MQLILAMIMQSFTLKHWQAQTEALQDSLSAAPREGVPSHPESLTGFSS